MKCGVFGPTHLLDMKFKKFLKEIKDGSEGIYLLNTTLVYYIKMILLKDICI